MWAKRSDVQDLHTVVLCLCVLGRVCVQLRRHERFFILQVGLQKRGLFKNILFTGLWAVLHIYYSVVGLESLPQLDVDLALHVHEHQSASEAYSHHHQFGPKRPFQYTLFDLLCCAVNEDVERPDDTCDGDDVKSDRAHDLPPLAGGHLKLLPLAEWFELGLHDEVVLAELAAACV